MSIISQAVGGGGKSNQIQILEIKNTGIKMKNTLDSFTKTQQKEKDQ